jgi:hypothetical protein
LNNIKGPLDSLLKKRDLYVKVRGTITLLKWSEIVGDTLAKYTQPKYYKEGVLYVGVVSGLFKRELEAMKGEILSKIINSAEDSPITDLQFRILNKAPLKKSINPPLPPKAVELSEDDLVWIEENTLRLKADEKLKKEYYDLLKAFKELEKVKQTAGYKKCKKCGALFKGNGFLCPVCEINDSKRI